MYTFFFSTVPSCSVIYTLSLHDALPICCVLGVFDCARSRKISGHRLSFRSVHPAQNDERTGQSRVQSKLHVLHLARSEEHTSELQSHSELVCRLLLEKKNSNDDEIGGKG